MDCPISSAKSRVPRPTVPPRSHPATKTEDSIARRTRPMRIPERLWIAVIKPSRGPGPRPQVIYRAEPKPTIAIPTKQYTTAIAKLSCCGKTDTPIWIAVAIITILEIVPKPGFSFNGIHSSNTTVLIAKVDQPIVISNRPDTP